MLEYRFVITDDRIDLIVVVLGSTPSWLYRWTYCLRIADDMRKMVMMIPGKRVRSDGDIVMNIFLENEDSTRRIRVG